MIVIDTASLYDAEAILTIDRIVLGDDTRQGELTQAIREGRCYVAKSSNKPVGYALFHTAFFGFGFISLIAVDPTYRRRGAARRLIETIKTACPTDKLFTSTDESNTAMQNLLESLQFIKSGYIENLGKAPELIYCAKRKS